MGDEGSLPQELLLLVFVHGFKGTDSTFLDFPKRLEHTLTESIRSVKVESIVFPAYEVGETNTNGIHSHLVRQKAN